jgi:hypothetical protein
LNSSQFSPRICACSEANHQTRSQGLAYKSEDNDRLHQFPHPGRLAISFQA